MSAGERQSQSGLTMTELLVSAVIVSFMLAVIIGLEFAVRSMERTSSTGGALYMQTLAVAENYRKSALRATGDTNDSGMDCGNSNLGNGNAANNYTCFRIDDARTAGVYTDDRWRCYSRLPSAGGIWENVYTCLIAAGGGPAACTASGTFIGKVLNTTFSTISCDDGRFSAQFISRQDNNAAVSSNNEQVTISVNVSAAASSAG